MVRLVCVALLSLVARAATAGVDPPRPIEEAPAEIALAAANFVGALQRSDRAVVESSLHDGFVAHFAAEHEYGVVSDQVLPAPAFLDRALQLASWQCPFEQTSVAVEPKLYWVYFTCSKTLVSPRSGIHITKTQLTLQLHRDSGAITGLWVVWKLPDDVSYPIEP